MSSWPSRAGNGQASGSRLSRSGHGGLGPTCSLTGLRGHRGRSGGGWRGWRRCRRRLRPRHRRRRCWRLRRSPPCSTRTRWRPSSRRRPSRHRVGRKHPCRTCASWTRTLTRVSSSPWLAGRSAPSPWSGWPTSSRRSKFTRVSRTGPRSGPSGRLPGATSSLPRQSRSDRACSTGRPGFSWPCTRATSRPRARSSARCTAWSASAVAGSSARR